MPKRDERIEGRLRWSRELHDKLAKEARKNHRSLNAEIVVRLEQSFYIEVKR